MTGRALHDIDGILLDDGRIMVREWTNDDQDRGYPTTSAQWDWIAKDRAEFDKRAGVSRVGVSGVVVTVTLDGEKL